MTNEEKIQEIAMRIQDLINDDEDIAELADQIVEVDLGGDFRNTDDDLKDRLYWATRGEVYTKAIAIMQVNARHFNTPS